LKVHGDARLPRRCYSEWSSVPGSAEHVLEAAPAGKASSSSTSTGTNVTGSDPSTEDPWDNVDAQLHAEVESLRQALCHVNRCVAETMVEVRLNRSLIDKSERRQELETPQLEQVLESLAEENKRLQHFARSEWATARRAHGTLRTMEENTDDQYRTLQEKHKRLELDNSRLRKELSAMNARVLGWRQLKRRVGKERRMWQTPPRSRSDLDTQSLAYVHERGTSCSSSSRALDSHTPETAYHDSEKEQASLEPSHSNMATTTSFSAESHIAEPSHINLPSTLVQDNQSETFSCETILPASQGNGIVDGAMGTELQPPSPELESAGHLHHLSDCEDVVPPPTPSSSRHIDETEVPKGCLPLEKDLVAEAVWSPSRSGDADLESTSTLPNQLSTAGDPLRLLPAEQDISRIQVPDPRCRSPSPTSRFFGIDSEVQLDLGTIHHCNPEVFAPVESGIIHHRNSEELDLVQGSIHHSNSEELDLIESGTIHRSNSEELDLVESGVPASLEEKSQPNTTKVEQLSALAKEAAEVSASARARAQAALLGHGFTKASRVSSPAAASRSSSVASSGDPAPVLSRRPSGEVVFLGDRSCLTQRARTIDCEHQNKRQNVMLLE